MGNGLMERLEGLVRRHRELEDPLLLAVLFHPSRDPDDVFLFEVVGSFGDGEVDPDRELFEVSFPSSPDFPLGPGRNLHLVLTSPEELQIAVAEQWPGVRELHAAAAGGDYTVLHQAGAGEELWELVTGNVPAGALG